MKQSMWLAVFLASFLIVGRAAAATYYFSSITGSDAHSSAQAQSKSAPWAHLPCMANATGNAAAYRPVAGDILVLKGGETWGHASFPCNWQWNGTSTNRITVTVDPTWYTGTSWTHPKWDAGGITITGTTGTSKNTFLDMTNSNFGVSYVTFDNIEMTRFFWTGNPAFGTCAQINGSVSTNVTLDHLYIHGWMHDTYANGTRDLCHTIVGNSNPPYNSGSVFQNGIIDGSDGTGGGDSGRSYLWPSWVNNVIHDTPNAIVQKGGGTISGNTIYDCHVSFDPEAHPNLLETLGGTSAHTVYIHDNVFHDYVAGCESAFIASQNGTVYVWNNIWYNNNGGNPPNFDQPAPTPPNIYFWNNTIVAAPGGYCVRKGHVGDTPAVIKIQNNHCITTFGTAFDPTIVATSMIIDHNVLQTPAAAAAEGYTSTQGFAYSPSSAGNATSVSAGIIPTSSCVGPFASLCVDTSYGQGFNASTKIVTGALRGTVSRSSGASWNVGAYQFPSTDTLSPAAPSNLSVK
jgi:hypothetical protein